MSVSLYNTNALALRALPTFFCLFVTGVPPGAHHLVAAGAEARKPKLRRYNSHDTGSNMFSVADFENARLMRRNEIELKQRLARRQRNSANGSYGLGGGGGGGSGGGAAVVAAAGGGCTSSNGYSSYNGFCGGLNGSGDYSTGDSKQSKLSSSSSEVSVNPPNSIQWSVHKFHGPRQEPLPADVFLERHSLPRIVRISYTNKSSNETLQSSSSHGSSTAASSSSSAGVKQQYSGSSNHNGNNNHDVGTNGTGTTSSSSGGSGNHHSSSAPGHDELFLLYRMVLQRHIYHGYNAKSQASQRKKTVLIPQEFPGKRPHKIPCWTNVLTQQIPFDFWNFAFIYEIGKTLLSIHCGSIYAICVYIVINIFKLIHSYDSYSVSHFKLHKNWNTKKRFVIAHRIEMNTLKTL